MASALDLYCRVPCAMPMPIGTPVSYGPPIAGTPVTYGPPRSHGTPVSFGPPAAAPPVTYGPDMRGGGEKEQWPGCGTMDAGIYYTMPSRALEE